MKMVDRMHMKTYNLEKSELKEYIPGKEDEPIKDNASNHLLDET
jgi:hypothetical protein